MIRNREMLRLSSHMYLKQSIDVISRIIDNDSLQANNSANVVYVIIIFRLWLDWEYIYLYIYI